MLKISKKILSIIMVVIMVLTAVPLSGFVGLELPAFDLGIRASALAESGQCGDNVYWNYNKNTGKVIISGIGEMYDYGYYYTDNASPFCLTDIKNVIIEDGVTSIGNNTFISCNNLVSVTISNSVVSIGNDSFASCTNLASITIPEGVRDIGREAFQSCYNLTSIIIPDSVIRLGKSAFYMCARLSNVIIGRNVTNIAEQLFRGCYGLISVSIPNSVTSIGDYAFCNCTSLANVEIGENVTSIGEYAFSSCDSLTDMLIPDNVTRIGKSAFSYCENLSNITIGNGVKSIGDFAFSDCIKLKNITIGKGLESVGYSAFDYCIDICDIYYEGAKSQWENVSFDLHNESLTTATIHFVTVDEEPAEPETPEKPNIEPEIPDKPDVPDTPSEPEAHEHSYTSTVIKAPSCAESGIVKFVCNCGDTYNEYPATLGHSDTDGNGICDVCGFGEEIKPDTPEDPSANCSCNCHKGGISGFIFKLILFFQRLFGSNKTCDCGASHY